MDKVHVKMKVNVKRHGIDRLENTFFFFQMEVVSPFSCDALRQENIARKVLRTINVEEATSK